MATLAQEQKAEADIDSIIGDVQITVEQLHARLVKVIAEHREILNPEFVATLETMQQALFAVLDTATEAENAFIEETN